MNSALREPPIVSDPDALIREARRRQRRRWIAIGAVVIVGSALALTAIGLRRHATTPRHAVRAAVPHHVVPHLPQTVGPQPEQPGSLALGADGGLYIADGVRDQILELRNGTFRVVVGNGTRGFSGDDGPATKAAINDPAGMTFHNGTLYFADAVNGRIREVSPTGIITTIAGNGRAGWVPDRTPALAATLSPTALTFGANGRLYVTADSQVLRLDLNGTFTRVIGNPTTTDALCGSGIPAVHACPDGAQGLAFDAKGDLYVFGSDTKALLMVNPKGTFKILSEFGFYPRGFSGLATAPDGTVIAMESESLVRLSPRGMHVLIAFPSYRQTFNGVENFLPNGLAIGPDGTMYVDTSYGNGYVDKSAIVAIHPNGTSTLLWRQNPPSPGREDRSSGTE
jgi:hypothetical protein